MSVWGVPLNPTVANAHEWQAVELWYTHCVLQTTLWQMMLPFRGDTRVGCANVGCHHSGSLYHLPRSGIYATFDLAPAIRELVQKSIATVGRFSRHTPLRCSWRTFHSLDVMLHSWRQTTRDHSAACREVFDALTDWYERVFHSQSRCLRS